MPATHDRRPEYTPMANRTLRQSDFKHFVAMKKGSDRLLARILEALV